MSKDVSLQKAAVETYTINTVLGKDDVSVVHVRGAIVCICRLACGSSIYQSFLHI